uniref:Peptidase C1A papain C-terminal domain-containing protein n=2 Tax=Aegilops tauschii TaxID=37682 RepID=A0A452ZKU3_AEGTS
AMPSTSANAITAGTAASGEVGGAKAAMDVMLGGVATDIGATYWFLEMKDWIGELMGSPRQYRPMESWSWIDIMGRPIGQNKGSCVLSACLMCLEAQHRLAFERRHGSDTFPYAIPRETAADLLETCKKAGVWTRKEGANVGKVLEVMQRNGGAVAWHEEGLEHCKLQIKSWERLPSPSSSSLARIMRTEGPLIGSLDVVRADYYAPGWQTRVYTGGSGKKKAVGHALVCMEYRLDGELIRVVDNHNWQGPVRWISKTAFRSFTQIKVEPLDAGALGIEVSWRRRLLRMLWREETFWWRQRRTLNKVWNKHH